ncbi:hypothetical protein Cadr_000012972 [Camelus dromedarius]|uniref:Uncharacterized protein n=1 Tax=Camelus dromedarius TaxID=9838 RepID=A0A5N4D984_CAMDR|nr:hypothetical protein Cadr_000012972 [Camelus dromedarius]
MLQRNLLQVGNQVRNTLPGERVAGKFTGRDKKQTREVLHFAEGKDPSLLFLLGVCSETHLQASPGSLTHHTQPLLFLPPGHTAMSEDTSVVASGEVLLASGAPTAHGTAHNRGCSGEMNREKVEEHCFRNHPVTGTSSTEGAGNDGGGFPEPAAAQRGLGSHSAAGHLRHCSGERSTANRRLRCADIPGERSLDLRCLYHAVYTRPSASGSDAPERAPSPINPQAGQVTFEPLPVVILDRKPRAGAEGLGDTGSGQSLPPCHLLKPGAGAEQRCRVQTNSAFPGRGPRKPALPCKRPPRKPACGEATRRSQTMISSFHCLLSLLKLGTQRDDEDGLLAQRLSHVSSDLLGARGLVAAHCPTTLRASFRASESIAEGAAGSHLSSLKHPRPVTETSRQEVHHASLDPGTGLNLPKAPDAGLSRSGEKGGFGAKLVVQGPGGRPRCTLWPVLPVCALRHRAQPAAVLWTSEETPRAVLQPGSQRGEPGEVEPAACGPVLTGTGRLLLSQTLCPDSSPESTPWGGLSGGQAKPDPGGLAPPPSYRHRQAMEGGTSYQRVHSFSPSLPLKQLPSPCLMPDARREGRNGLPACRSWVAPSESEARSHTPDSLSSTLKGAISGTKEGGQEEAGVWMRDLSLLSPLTPSLTSRRPLGSLDPDLKSLSSTSGPTSSTIPLTLKIPSLPRKYLNHSTACFYVSPRGTRQIYVNADVGPSRGRHSLTSCCLTSDASAPAQCPVRVQPDLPAPHTETPCPRDSSRSLKTVKPFPLHPCFPQKHLKPHQRVGFSEAFLHTGRLETFSGPDAPWRSHPTPRRKKKKTSPGACCQRMASGTLRKRLDHILRGRGGQPEALSHQGPPSLLTTRTQDACRHCQNAGHREGLRRPLGRWGLCVFSAQMESQPRPLTS